LGVFYAKISQVPVKTVASSDGVEFKFTREFIMQKARPEFGRAFLFLSKKFLSKDYREDTF